MKAVRQLTAQPVRFLINTETHNDHTTGNFVFAPPALVIAARGATQGIKDYYDPKRNEKLMAQGKTLDEIKKELRLPEYQSWSSGKERLDTNVEAAFRALKK